jgi:hypothetical protein
MDRDIYRILSRFLRIKPQIIELPPGDSAQTEYPPEPLQYQLDL